MVQSFCISILTILVFLYCTTKSFKIYTPTIGPIQIPQYHISTNINMENTFVPLLYSLFGCIYHVSPSCECSVMMKISFVTLSYYHIIFLKINSFWWWFIFLYIINIVNSMPALLSVAYYRQCHDWLLCAFSFSWFFFCSKDDDKNLFFLFKNICIPQDSFILREWKR